MRTFKIIAGLCLLVLIISPAFQIGSSELANLQLRDDIQDLASQFDTRTGYSSPKSDEDYQNAVIRKAKDHGIDLQPDQVTVERSGSGKESTIYLTAKYTVPVKLFGFSFDLHFVPASTKTFS
jgi:hypothetical protein